MSSLTHAAGKGDTPACGSRRCARSVPRAAPGRGRASPGRPACPGRPPRPRGRHRRPGAARGHHRTRTRPATGGRRRRPPPRSAVAGRPPSPWRRSRRPTSGTAERPRDDLQTGLTGEPVGQGRVGLGHVAGRAGGTGQVMADHHVAADRRPGWRGAGVRPQIARLAVQEPEGPRQLNTDALCQELAVVGRIPEQELRRLGPLEIQMGRVLPGEADAAVDLDVLRRGVEVRLGAVGLGTGWPPRAARRSPRPPPRPRSTPPTWPTPPRAACRRTCA